MFKFRIRKDAEDFEAEVRKIRKYPITSTNAATGEIELPHIQKTDKWADIEENADTKTFNIKKPGKQILDRIPPEKTDSEKLEI